MKKEGKKDIMDLLVRARKESLESEPSGWSTGDKAMMDQVVSNSYFRDVEDVLNLITLS